MAEFWLGHSDLFPAGARVEKIVVQSGKQITLELKDWPKDSGKPKLSVSPAPSQVSVSEPVATGGKWRFTVKAHGAGAPRLAAVAADGRALGVLQVFAGPFRNHRPEGEGRDLIADVFRSGDPAKALAFTQLLTNDPDNLFNEKSAANVRHWGELACGTVGKWGGAHLINPKTEYEDQKPGKPGGSLHEPIDLTKKDTKTRADVLYKKGTIDKVGRAIKKNLDSGLPVLVSLAYNVKDMRLDRYGDLVHTGPGAHTVLIVGCNNDGTEFLYVDVWPDGSRLKYTGGPAAYDVFPEKCKQLGVFKVMPDAVRDTDILRTRPDTQGFFAGDSFLEVIFGPRR
jgi:hypothetical protein